MDLETALRDWNASLATAEQLGRRDTRLRAIREVLVRICLSALEIEGPQPSIDATIRLASEAPVRSARRICAVLVVHALGVSGAVPRSSASDLCTLMERGLRDALLRCGYPFGGSTGEKMRVLEHLHRNIAELMQPLEPTFPNWQGLYAG